MSTHTIEGRVTVKITINDAEVINRVVENKDGWREKFYPLYDEADVLGHLAWNAVMNGVTSASDLDGWADLQYNAATMQVMDFEVE